MCRFVASLLLSVIVLCSNSFAFMTGYVDGGKVYWSAEKSYTLDPTLKYIGCFSRQYSGKELNSLRSADHTMHFEVFGRPYKDTNELVEIFIAVWDKLPSGWNYLPKGPLNEKLYEFKVSRFNGLAELLKAKGYTTTNEFYGGILKGFNKLNVSTIYIFAVADTNFPDNVAKQSYVREQFNKLVVEDE